MSSDLPEPIRAEPKFKWRRIFTYVTGSVILALLTILVFRVDGDSAKETIAICLAVNLWWLMTLYIVGPSGEQVFRMLSTIKFEALPGPLSRATSVVTSITQGRSGFPDAPFGETK